MRSLLVLLCLLIPLAGCGPSEPVRIKNELISVAMQYHAFSADTGSAPTSAEALINYADPNGNLPGNKARADATSKALKSGDYTVYWGYDIAAGTNRNFKTILAFHKDTPKNGGLAAFADGTVLNMNEVEFKNTAKASEFVSEPIAQP